MHNKLPEEISTSGYRGLAHASAMQTYSELPQPVMDLRAEIGGGFTRHLATHPKTTQYHKASKSNSQRKR